MGNVPRRNFGTVRPAVYKLSAWHMYLIFKRRFVIMTVLHETLDNVF